MAKLLTESDADILDLLAFPENGLNVNGARALLALQFDKQAIKEIRQLLQKNNRGKITAGERVRLEKFLRVGKLIDLMQAKARLFLHQQHSTHGQ